MTNPTSLSRRQVAQGAAWTLPVVALGASAPAMAQSLACPGAGTQNISESYVYDAFLEFFGESSLGQWTIDVTTQVPGEVAVNDVVSPTLTVTVTTSVEAADRLRDFGAVSVASKPGAGGEWNLAGYVVSGVAGSPGSKQVPITVADTPVPATGPIVINLTVTPTPEAMVAAGDFTVALANMATMLQMTDANGNVNTLEPAIRLRPAAGTDTWLFTLCAV